jgi:hypothetical protein
MATPFGCGRDRLFRYCSQNQTRMKRHRNPADGTSHAPNRAALRA